MMSSDMTCQSILKVFTSINSFIEIPEFILFRHTIPDNRFSQEHLSRELRKRIQTQDLGFQASAMSPYILNVSLKETTSVSIIS